MSQQDGPNANPRAPSFDTQVVAPISPEVLAIEILSSSLEMKLLEQGDFEVYCTPKANLFPT